MGKLYDQLERKLYPGMTIPDPLRQLYDWIEANGLFVEQGSGARIGFLFPEAEQKSSWTKKGRLGGTSIEFSAAGSDGLDHWFGHADPQILSRLCVFAQTGGEGSMAAFWLDDTGAQKIVHLGSGSGSTLVCVLCSSPLDFIRLLAIGYDEICWNSEFSTPPNRGDFKVEPNRAFQEWVTRTFNTLIPQSAAEIVMHPNEMGDEDPEDEFAKWILANTR